MKLALLMYLLMTCHGAFEYRTGDPDSLFPFQNAIQSCTSPVVMTNPAVLPFADGLLINSNAGRPYSEEALTTGGSAIQYGAGEYGMQFSWNLFGTEFYREQTFSIKGGYTIFPFLHTGMSENLYYLKVHANELSLDRAAADTDFAVLATPFPWLNAAFIQTGIVNLLTGQNSDILYPERSFGILIKPGNGFSLTWNISDTAVEIVNTLSATINPTSFFSVNGGYCRENSSFSASFGVLASNYFITYGFKYHPYLGYSHSIGITFSLTPQIESLQYGKPLFSLTAKKININNSTLEELKEIDGLNTLSAERILLYRQKIGPLTEKALMQIGLTGEEIKLLETKVYGLERTPRNTGNHKEFKKYKKLLPRKERIKDIFRKLINAGIPASAAFTYGELSQSIKNQDFINRLHSDNSLSNEQKSIIEKICPR